MLNLSQLRFEVDSSQLEKAVGTIREIGTAMDSLAKSSGKVTTSAEDTAKVIQKTSKVVKDSNEDIAESGDKVTAALEKATNALRFQADGYSKGQSGQLAYLKSLGATTEQLKEYGDVLQKQRVLQGTNPFDASLSSMVAIRNEYRLLVDAQRQYGSGAELTMQQMKDLTIEKMRLITTAQMEGTSFKELRNSIRQLEAQYETAAGKVNNLRAAQAAQDKAAKDTANANAYIAKEMERVTFATSAMNSELNRSTSNALLRFEKQLKLSGLSVDEQTAKLNAYKAALLQMDAASKKTNTDYVSRALGPQITDIFVGLSTGQSPLTVMLQQGGQLRDQFALAGIEADKMGQMMRTAAADMVVSVKAVALAFGQLIGGAFIDAGKSLGSSLANVLGMTAAIAKMNEAVAASAATGNMWALSLQVIGHVLPMVFGAALAASTVALVGFGIGLKQVIKEEDNLAKQLALTGGALNISTNEAIAYARALDQGNVSTGKAIEVITEMAKAGNLGRQSIAIITKAAVDMEKYAGVSIEETVKSFSKMKEKPVEALIELAKQTGMVSEETIRSVIELQKQGKEVDAASAAIVAYGEVTTKRVEQMKRDYSNFSLFMKDLGTDISNFFADVFKDLWYKADPGTQMEQQLGQLNDKIREVESNLGKLGGFGKNDFLDQLKKQRDALLEQIDAYDRKNARRRDEQALNLKAADMLQVEYELEKKYEDELLKAGKKRLTQEEYIAKKTQEQLEEQAKKLGRNVTEIMQNEKLLKLAQDRAKLMWEQENKPKSSKEKTETYSVVADNTAAQLQKEYNAELSAAKTLSTDKLDILKAELSAKLISQSEYNSQAEALIAQSEQNQFNVISDYVRQINEAYDNMRKKKDEAFASLPEKDQQNEQNIQKYKADIENLSNAQQAFNMQVSSTVAKLDSDIFKRNTKNAIEHQGAIKALSKAYEDYLVAEGKVAEQRNRENVLREQLRWATPEQAAYIQAVAKETDRLTQAQQKLADAVREANKEFEEASKNGPNPAAQKLAYEKLLAAQSAYNKALAENSVKEQQAGIDAVINYQRDQLKEFSNGLSDAIVTAMFEGGKAGAGKFRDIVVAQLKKPVVMIVNAVVNALLGSVMGSIGNSLVGSALSSAGGSLLGSAAGSALGAGSWLGGGSFLGMLGNIGSGVTTGFSTLFTEGIGAWFSQGTGLMGAGSMGGGLGVLGGPLAILGGLALLSSTLDKSGTPHYGAASQYSGGAASGNAGLFTGYTSISGRYSSQNQAAMDQVALGFGKVLDETAKVFGKEAGYSLLTAYSDDSSDDPGFGALRITRGDKTVLDWEDQRTSKWAAKIFKDGEEGWKEYLSAISKDVRDVMMKDLDLPTWANDILGKLGDSVSLETLTAAIAEINKINTAFKTFEYTLVGFAEMSDEARGKLLEAAGGIDALAQSATTYYENFYSEQERQVNSIRMLSDEFAAQGLALPKTRAEYRKLVESIDTSTDAGAKLYAFLLKMSGAFASISDSEEDLMNRRLNAAKREADILKQAEDMRNKAINDAFNALKEATAREKAEITKRLDPLKKTRDSILKVMDILSNAIDDLQGKALAPKEYAQQGFDFIRNAIASGGLPDAEGLSKAISKAQGGLVLDNFSSLAEQRYAQLKLAGELQKLKEISGDQLSDVEYQIKILEDQMEALDANLEYWKKQVDLATKGLEATLSVVDATENLKIALSKSLDDVVKAIKEQEPDDFGALLKQFTDLSSKYTPTLDPEYLKVIVKAVNDGLLSLSEGVNLFSGKGQKSAAYKLLVEDQGMSESDFYKHLRSQFDLLNKSGASGQKISDAMFQYGITITDMAKAFGFTVADVAAWLLMNGATTLPALATGTNFVPDDMVAQIHKGERLIPAADNAEMMQMLRTSSSGTSSQAIVYELQQLRVANQQVVERLNKIEQNTKTSSDVLFNVTEGGNAMRQVAV